MTLIREGIDRIAKILGTPKELIIEVSTDSRDTQTTVVCEEISTRVIHCERVSETVCFESKDMDELIEHLTPSLVACSIGKIDNIHGQDYRRELFRREREPINYLVKNG